MHHTTLFEMKVLMLFDQTGHNIAADTHAMFRARIHVVRIIRIFLLKWGWNLFLPFILLPLPSHSRPSFFRSPPLTLTSPPTNPIRTYLKAHRQQLFSM
jgi:hypothetical protein